jgi:signal transduction histidine kinase
MGLRLRLTLYLLLPTVVVLAAYAYLRVHQDRDAAEAEFARRTAAASTAIRLAIERALRDEAGMEVARLADDLVTKQTEIVRVRLLDQKLGTVVDRNLLPDDPGAPPALLRRALDSGQAEAEWRRAADLGLYSAIVPVRPDGGMATAVLEIVYLHGRLEDDLGEVTRQTAVQVGLVLLVLLGLGGFVLQRTVFRPLRELTGAMHRVTDGGDLATEVPVRRRDELGRVAAAFNAMIQRLRAARHRLDVEMARTVDLSTQLLRTDSLAAAGRLCAGLAHEVGTPLNIIAGRAELVLQALPPQDRYREDLQVILAQIERISRIIRAALDPFRPHAPDIQPTALGPLVDAILPLLRHFARSRGVTLGVAIPADIATVRTDVGHLQHALITLIMSAVEATPRGGRVELAAQEDGTWVTISVRDTGPGIPADVLPKLFDPLAAVRRPGNGTGLGLATSQDFMKQLGTQIRVESAENAGTTFSVSLPRVPANGGEVNPG